jgi:uroporphyrinogen-III decarboxylase
MKIKDYDLSERYRKIKNTIGLNEVKNADDIPIIINTPCYFGFGSKLIPNDYYENPESMIDYQEKGCLKHLESVEDDYIPYFMPWFGTGVLASGFGCKIKFPSEPDADPSVVEKCIFGEKDIRKIKIPDPYKSGLMPKVLNAIDYASANSDLPPGLTDMNSPFSTACQMCGYDQLLLWMYDRPQLVHKIMELVTESFIEWTRIQKKHIGEPLNQSNGLQGVWSPEGVGIWVSDDDLTILSPELYQEYVVPYNSKVFKYFGGGSVHFCGNGLQQTDSILNIENIRVINNSPMADFITFEKMLDKVKGRVAIQVQDISPIDFENYYLDLFKNIHDLRGIMIASFTVDSFGMDNKGRLVPVKWDNYKTANKISRFIRDIFRKKLS